MKCWVIEAISLSDFFDIPNATKQDCVLAPFVCSISLALMLLVAFKDCDLGIPIHTLTDGNVFNLWWLQAVT